MEVTKERIMEPTGCRVNQVTMVGVESNLYVSNTLQACYESNEGVWALAGPSQQGKGGVIKKRGARSRRCVKCQVHAWRISSKLEGNSEFQKVV